MLYSTIFKKASMAISGLFLIIFLLQHFAINITSVFSGDLFNQLSHFMGTNPLVIYKGNSNASWVSRNMIISGSTVLAFLVLHFYDFWIPEMDYKYVKFLPENPDRYFEELVHKFEDITRVVLYVISFFFLALHLSHGFASSFQTMGFNNKYTVLVKSFGKLYAFGIPFGFAFIAIYHYLNH